MSLFQPSSLAATAARTLIAETAGAQLDAEMLTRATRSLDAVAQRWNRLKWKFLQTEQSIPIAAPFTVSGCSATAGATTLTTTVASGFTSVLADDMVVNLGAIYGNTLVSATGATSLTLTNPAVTTFSGATITFRRPIYALATDIKGIYDVRLTENPRPLFYIQNRTYDRLVFDQISAGAVVAYDLYRLGQQGKIRFIAAPGTADLGHVKYMRRLGMPSALMTNATATLDVPQDYEDVFLAAAKAYFLADKKDTYDRAQWWDRYAREGLAQIRSDQFNVADEVLTFDPPHFGQYTYTNPNVSPPWWESFP